MSEDTQQDEVDEVVEEEIDNVDDVEGEEDQGPEVPEIVDTMMPELADTWLDLTPDKQADLLVRLREMEKAKTLPTVNPDREAEDQRQSPAVDRQIPLYDLDGTRVSLKEALEEGDFDKVSDMLMTLHRGSYDGLHAINDELTNQAQSQVPRDVQLALDSVPGSEMEDIKAATKNIQSGRTNNVTDALRLAVMDRGGLMSEQPVPNGRKKRSRRASNHGKSFQPGKVEVPITNNNDDLVKFELAIQEADQLGRK